MNYLLNNFVIRSAIGIKHGAKADNSIPNIPKISVIAKHKIIIIETIQRLILVSDLKNSKRDECKA